MPQLKLLFLILLFISSVYGCQNSNDQEFKSIDFKLNKSLISSNSVLLGSTFNFNPPKVFNPVSAEQFSAVKKTIEGDSSAFFRLKLHNVFTNPKMGSIIISQVKTDDIFAQLDSSYTTLLEHNFKTKNINKAKIKINTIKSVQYLITTAELVNIKLFISSNNTVFQIDYLILKQAYANMLSDIESSIGSITKH